MVDARRPGVVVLAGEGALGGAEPADLELLIGQLLTPGVERFSSLSIGSLLGVCSRFVPWPRHAHRLFGTHTKRNSTLYKKADLYLFRWSGRTYHASLFDA